MSLNPTASSLEACLACPASVALPVRAHGSNEYAEAGHARHGYLQRVLPPVSMPPEDALAYVPKELRAQCQAIDLSRVLGDIARSARSEVAYAFSMKTGRVIEIGTGISRHYPEALRKGTYVCGTLDIEGRTLAGAWRVRDVKSGYRDVTDAKTNPQLLFFALVLSRLHGTEDGPIGGAIVRLEEDGGVHVDSAAVYDAFDLDALEEDLRRLLERIRLLKRRTKRLELFEGEHCRYCPAFQSCPAKQGLVRRLLPELEEIKSAALALTPEDAGRAWGVLQRIKPLYKLVDNALKEYAKLEPIPLEGGKWLRAAPYESSRFDAAAAVVLLRNYGATEEEIEALRRPIKVEPVRECKTPR